MINMGQKSAQFDMIPVRHLMEKAVTENVFPGAVLLVSKKGELVFHEAFGFRN